MKFKLCLAAILCSLAPLLASAEDAPAPPKAEAPAPAAGAIPSYPLKSDNFNDIAEGDVVKKDGRPVGLSDPDNEAENIEPRSLEDIFTALKQTPQSYLREHYNQNAEYMQLLLRSPDFRGHIVKLSGVYQVVNERELEPPRAGLNKYWKGQISGAGGKITTFIAIAPIPDDFVKGKAVDVYGVFMKRYVYRNRSPGEQGTWSPLVICRTLEHATDFERSGEASWLFGPAGIGGLVAIGAIVIFLWVRMSRQSTTRRTPVIPRVSGKAKPTAPPPPSSPPPSAPPGEKPSSV